MGTTTAFLASGNGVSSRSRVRVGASYVEESEFRIYNLKDEADCHC